MAGPQPLPKRFLHLMRAIASSFKWENPLLSPSSSSFLRLLVTSICPCIFPSITCFIRQFLRRMWPFQLAVHFLISCRIFLCSLTHHNLLMYVLRPVLLTGIKSVATVILHSSVTELRAVFQPIRMYQTSNPRALQTSLAPYITHSKLWTTKCGVGEGADLASSSRARNKSSYPKTCESSLFVLFLISVFHSSVYVDRGYVHCAFQLQILV
jgi:hypothetical protein